MLYIHAMRFMILLPLLLLASCATTDFSGLSPEQKVQMFSAMSQSMRVEYHPVQYQPMPIQTYPQVQSYPQVQQYETYQSH